jgi:F0F1-type ATP synthase assembly protein I
MALSTGRMMRFASIGLEFAWPMIAGAILGHYLDLDFHTDPWLTLVMFLLGVFIGFYRLIQELALFQRENRES